MDRASGDITAREAGRLGGKATAERYGHKFYVALGKKGGQMVADKYGHEHFVEIGNKGGQRVKEMCAAGRAALGLPIKD